jgi:excisionase family DNA binding protein
METLELPDGLLTVADVTRLLRVSAESVRNWIAAGKLAAFRLGPTGPWRIRSEDLAAYINGGN